MKIGTDGAGVTRQDTTVILAAFPRALSAAGIACGPDRVRHFLTACERLGAQERRGVYWAGRATLTSGAEDIETYDRVFEAYFSDNRRPIGARPPAAVQLHQVAFAASEEQESEGAEGDAAPPVHAVAAATEVLRHKDIAKLTADERAELDALLALLAPGLPSRPSLRRRPAPRGRVDLRRTVRGMLAAQGEPGLLARERKRTRPRRIVLLIDVSGSMAPYADALLRFAHAMVRHARGAVEVFTIGTRLSRVTKALALPDADAALAAAAEVIPDYSGGTRLGEVIRAFTDRWGQRGMARGAVLVVFSDGWERGSTQLLAEQMQRLGRLTRMSVWVNPHKGKDGYEPVQSGIVAVLPHLDSFLAGHSLATLEQLIEVIRDA